MANVLIKTWGCTANQDNGAIMAGLLLREGNTLVKVEEEADVVIFNTCTVKGVTQNKIVDELKVLNKRFPEKKILVSGCMAGAQEQLLKKMNPNTSLVNTMHLTEIPKVVDRLVEGEVVTLTQQRYENKANLPKMYKEEGIATIQISQGCADCCFFCITRLSQGFVKSFPVEDIKAEVERAVASGIRKIYLTSQDNGAYGLDRGRKSELVSLLKEVVNIPSGFKVRVGMTNPRHIVSVLDELVEVFKNEKVMKFLHVPVQAGSEKVLKEMNRGHSVEDFKKIVKAFREKIPGMIVSTDIICGYPSETEEDFEETLRLVKEIKPEVLNISKFAPRPWTVAGKMRQLPTGAVKERTRRLTEVFRMVKEERLCLTS